MDLQTIKKTKAQFSMSNLNLRLLGEYETVPVTIKFTSVKAGVMQPLMMTAQTAFPERTRKVEDVKTLGDIVKILRDDIGCRMALDVLKLTADNIIDVYVSVYHNQMGKMLMRAMWDDDGPNLEKPVWEGFISESIIPAHEHLRTDHGPYITIKMQNPK